MTSNMYFGLLLLTVAIVSARKNCTKTDFFGQTTTITCPETCCGSSVFRYCCDFGPSDSTTKPCIRRDFDGTVTTLNCQNDCCGTEDTRYCCIRAGGGSTKTKSCTQKTGLFDDTVTTITCPNGCCGTELTRYCCTDISGIKDIIDAGTSLSKTVIIIIAVACVVVVATIVGIIICCCCCCRKAASSSSGGRPGMVVNSGQAHSNAAYNPGKPVSYPMTQQGYGDSSKPQYPNAGSGSNLYPEVQAQPPMDTKGMRM